MNTLEQRAIILRTLEIARIVVKCATDLVKYEVYIAPSIIYSSNVRCRFLCSNKWKILTDLSEEEFTDMWGSY